MKKTSKNPPAIDRRAAADAEYARLIAAYTDAGVDKTKLTINDRLIRKVAELFGTLEAIKELPSIYFDPARPTEQKETAAGKMRVKYMAQYASCMQKLNKDMLGDLNGDDDDGLGDYE